MAPEESTFRTYTSDQATTYSASRTAYHPRLYSAILTHHTATAGQLHTLLDLGCGPGNATRPLALHFENAVGVDASEGMIGAARAGGGKTGVETKVRWVVGRAEGCGEGIVGIGEDGEAEGKDKGERKVDLVTGGMAAHWFDPEEFWRSAAKMVRNGGTVAFWIVDHMYFRQSSHPFPYLPALPLSTPWCEEARS